jgi:hypothetical protein
MAFSRLKQKLRQMVLDALRRALHSAEGHRMLTDSLSGLLAPPPEISPDNWMQATQEYPDLASVPQSPASSSGSEPIFITARFRSGSTLLWNLFRQLPECTAYYEPLNERRWFDPQARGTRVDPSHQQVEDYWREYEGLSHLSSCFRTEWNERRLYMDAHASDAQMREYLRALIHHAAGRAVLQFNRVDFRLPWLKQHFPAAKIVHLSRHPRDSWFSSLMSKEHCPREITIAKFARFDELYLLHWKNDLQTYFPILSDPALKYPYQLYYCLWKLSYAFGVKYADYHLTYESLLAEPESQIAQLLSELDLSPASAGQLAQLVKPTGQRKWIEYADERWFLEQESLCERLLIDYYPVSSNQTAPAAVTSTY